MSEKERLVSFTLLGQEFSFYTGASEEEMEEILSLVKKLVEDSVTGTQSGTIPVGKTAIMACLNIASQYLRLERDFEEYKKVHEMKAGSLVDKIDACLLSEKRNGSV